MVNRVALVLSAIAGLALILGAAGQALGAVVVSVAPTPVAWHGQVFIGPRPFGGGVIVAPPPYPYYAPYGYPYYPPGYYPPGPGVIVVPRHHARVLIAPPAFGFGFRW